MEEGGGGIPSCKFSTQAGVPAHVVLNITSRRWVDGDWSASPVGPTYATSSNREVVLGYQRLIFDITL